jgi:hypothetical protein
MKLLGRLKHVDSQQLVVVMSAIFVVGFLAVVWSMGI